VIKQLLAKASTGFSGAVVQFIVLNAVVKGSWVLVENELQNRIGHVEYGRYAAALQLALLGTVVFDLAAGLYLTQQLGQHWEASSERRALLSSFIRMRLVLTGAYIVILAGAAAALGFAASSWQLMGVLILAGALLNWLALLRNILQAERRWGLDAWASVADKAALLALVPLLLASSLGALELALAVLASAGFAFVVFLALVWRQLPSTRDWAFRQGARFRWAQILPADIIKGSLPFVTYALILSALERVGQIAVERLAGPEASGLFAAAFRWTSAALMGIYLLQPWFFARFSGASEPERTRLVIRGTALFGMGMALISVAFIGFPQIVLRLLSHSTEAELHTITQHLQWQSLALWITGCCVVMGTHEAATGNLRGLRTGLAVVLLAYIAALCAFVRPDTGQLGSVLLLLAWAAQAVVYTVLYLRHTSLVAAVPITSAIASSAAVLGAGLALAWVGVGVVQTAALTITLTVVFGVAIWRATDVKVS
jgi:O-antigen/teichoic acid export membrane protein